MTFEKFISNLFHVDKILNFCGQIFYNILNKTIQKFKIQRQLNIFNFLKTITIYMIIL